MSCSSYHKTSFCVGFSPQAAASARSLLQGTLHELQLSSRQIHFLCHRILHGLQGGSAPLWISMGSRRTTCLTTTFSTGCRENSAPMPSTLPPTSFFTHLGVSRGVASLMFFFFTAFPLTAVTLYFLTFSKVSYHRSTTGITDLLGFGTSWKWLPLTKGQPQVSPYKRPALQAPTFPKLPM